MAPNVNNTEEWWSITAPDGTAVSLHQYGWSVTTVGGSRYDLPPRRGTNLSLAYRPGQIQRRKLPDARPITLLMFMVGFPPGLASAVGQNPVPIDQRTQWNDNWDTLRRLVYRNSLHSGLVTLTRRWRLTAPEFPNSRNGQDVVINSDPGTPPGNVSRILIASAQAEMTGNMAPTMTGRFRSDFQLDFTLPDPYFYGSTVTAPVNKSQTIYVWNDGHEVAAHNNMEVRFVGPLTKPTLVNQSVSPENRVYYNGTIRAGKTVTLNIGRYTAVEHNSDDDPIATATNNKIGQVSSAGARLWFNMLPGANKLRLGAVSDSQSGSSQQGHAEVRFRPPYV